MQSDTNQSVPQQIAELADRLARLEGRLGRAPDLSPDVRNTGHLGHCNLPPVPERTFGPEVSPERARLVRDIGRKWVSGTKLRYYFFTSGPYAGASPQKEIVRRGFELWKELGIGISFQEITDITEAEIRIGFLQGDGAWSYIGRDIIDIPGQGERTMNFGWDLTKDPRGVDVPVHEIGHTLGFPHEHQNPFSGIVWNEQAEIGRAHV